MIWNLKLDPSRGQFPAPPGRNGFFKRNGMMECPQQGSNLKVHIHLFWIFRWHSWGEYLYITLRTPALGTEPQICTRMHAHLVVRVKRMDGAHTSPNSLFRAVNSQLATRESQWSPPSSSQDLESKVKNQRLPIQISNLNAKDETPRIKC